MAARFAGESKLARPPFLIAGSMSGMKPGLLAELAKAELLMKAVDAQLIKAAFDAWELSIAANASGEVVVSGIVRSADEKLRATQIATAVPGVTKLVNSLLVIP